jgi:DNA ligase-1
LKPFVLDKCPRDYKTTLEPDVWFQGHDDVWEVLCADISISPVHGAGFSIRFPRFLKRRTDKTPDQATSKAQVMSLFHNQSHAGDRITMKKEEAVEEDEDS